jgi:hypothetical protein
MSLVPRNVILAYAGLLACVALAWANSLQGGPIFDDHWLVVQNQCFRSWDGLWRILSFDPSDVCAYRPTRYFSYGVDRLLFGDTHWSYHLGNVIRHGLAALAAGWLATGIFVDARGLRQADASAFAAGFAVALLWALHPVQTDSVSYVSGRRDILVGVWSLLTLALARVAVQRRGLWWLAPLWSLLLAFLSKENAAVVPILYLVWLVRNRSPLELFGPYRMPLVAALCGVLLAGGLLVQRGLLASYSQRGVFEWWGGTLSSNFATVAALQLHYLRHAFTGGPLIGDYYAETIPLAAGFSDPRAIAGVFAVVILVTAALSLRRRMPVVAYGIIFYLVALLPMSHVIPHHELYAEHYLYLPLFGVVLSAVGAVVHWLGPAMARASLAGRFEASTVAAVVGLALVATVQMAAVHLRNVDWRDERSFYEAVLRTAPGNQRALGNLLFIYSDLGEHEPALAMCAQLAPLWVAGAEQERLALLRCVVAAERTGNVSARVAMANQLTAHHPEHALGWRHLAEAELSRARHVRAFGAAMRWWELTRSPDALFVAAQAAASTPEVSVSEVGRLGEALASTHGVAVGARVQLALALARRGESRAAYEAFAAIDAAALPPELVETMCQLRSASGSDDINLRCEPAATGPGR